MKCWISETLNQLNARDYILLFSTTTAIAVFFGNQWFQRRHDIAKKRLERRLMMYRQFLDFRRDFIVDVHMSKKEKRPPKVPDSFNEIQAEFYIWGEDSEMQEIERLFNFFISSEFREAEKLMGKLSVKYRNRLRKALRIKTIKE